MLAELHVPEKLMPTKVRKDVVSVIVFVECFPDGRTMCRPYLVFNSEGWCFRAVGRFGEPECFCLGLLLISVVDNKPSLSGCL